MSLRPAIAREPMTDLHVKLPPSLTRAIRKTAKAQASTPSAVVRAFIAAGLRRQQADARLLAEARRAS